MSIVAIVLIPINSISGFSIIIIIIFYTLEKEKIFMKRIFKGLLLIVAVLSLSTACFKRDDMENINVITTIYPIEYISNYLYGVQHHHLLS